MVLKRRSVMSAFFVWSFRPTIFVTPAKAGVQLFSSRDEGSGMPAFAGMTDLLLSSGTIRRIADFKN